MYRKDQLADKELEESKDCSVKYFLVSATLGIQVCL